LKFERLKFYMTPQEPARAEAFAFFSNRYGAWIDQYQLAHGTRDVYDVSILVAVKPHPRDTRDAVVARINPLGQHLFMDLTRAEVEGLLDEIEEFPRANVESNVRIAEMRRAQRR